MTDHYAVFGNPIAHSSSPRIHAMFAIQTCQDIEYAARLAPTKGFAGEIRSFIEQGGRGANVTVPFKLEAYELATRLSLRARLAGAVNTLSFSDNEILGDNTDGVGLVRDLLLNHQIKLAGRRILLLGAGGAARGVLQPLLDERPARLVVANRTVQKAQLLLAEMKAPTHGVEALNLVSLAGQTFDLIINATSSGLDGVETSPLHGVSPAPTGEFAYDMMYGRETGFMAQAQALGMHTTDGLGMLIEQAAEAFYLWRGVRPDTGSVLNTMRSELANKQ